VLVTPALAWEEQVLVSVILEPGLEEQVLVWAKPEPGLEGQELVLATLALE